jgi:hypothetical protein
VARGGVFISIICATTTVALDWLLMNIMPKNALERFALEAMAGGLLYGLLLFNMPNLIPAELAQIIERLADRCPRTLARFLRRLTPAQSQHVKR